MRSLKRQLISAADHAAKGASLILSPAIQKLRGERAVAALESYVSFLRGKGAGSGWDIRSEINAAKKCITRKDAIIFDVGANDGRWSTALAKAVCVIEPRFYLFECSPYVLPHLRKHLHEIPNPTVIEAAVGDCIGLSQLYTPDRGSGLASLYERKDAGIAKENWEKVPVSTTTVDAIVEEYSIGTVDYLKMDIEGHELAALRGASRSLERRIVHNLTFEFGSANVNSRTFFRDYFDMLSSFGFRIFRIGVGGTLFPVVRYSEDLEYYRGATNYLARLVAEV